jgi:hypothetical protein
VSYKGAELIAKNLIIVLNSKYTAKIAAINAEYSDTIILSVPLPADVKFMNPNVEELKQASRCPLVWVAHNTSPAVEDAISQIENRHLFDLFWWDVKGALTQEQFEKKLRRAARVHVEIMAENRLSITSPSVRMLNNTVDEIIFNNTGDFSMSYGKGSNLFRAAKISLVLTRQENL